MCIWGIRTLRVELDKRHRDIIACKVMGLCLDFDSLHMRIFGMGGVSGRRDVLAKTAMLVELG